MKNVSQIDYVFLIDFDCFWAYRVTDHNIVNPIDKKKGNNRYPLQYSYDFTDKKISFRFDEIKNSLRYTFGSSFYKSNVFGYRLSTVEVRKAFIESLIEFFKIKDKGHIILLLKNTFFITSFFDYKELSKDEDISPLLDSFQKQLDLEFYKGKVTIISKDMLLLVCSVIISTLDYNHAFLFLDEHTTAICNSKFHFFDSEIVHAKDDASPFDELDAYFKRSGRYTKTEKDIILHHFNYDENINGNSCYTYVKQDKNVDISFAPFFPLYKKMFKTQEESIDDALKEKPDNVKVHLINLMGLRDNKELTDSYVGRYDVDILEDKYLKDFNTRMIRYASNLVRINNNPLYKIEFQNLKNKGHECITLAGFFYFFSPPFKNAKVEELVNISGMRPFGKNYLKDYLKKIN